MRTRNGRTFRLQERKNGTRKTGVKQAEEEVTAGKTPGKAKATDVVETAEESPRLRWMAQVASELGRAPGTNVVNNTHMSYWNKFCEVMGRNEEQFGTTTDRLGIGSIAEVSKELRELGDFASYVVMSPRRKGKEFNSVDYAGQAISSVWSAYGERTGRRPGIQHFGNATTT